MERESKIIPEILEGLDILFSGAFRKQEFVHIGDIEFMLRKLGVEGRCRNLSKNPKWAFRRDFLLATIVTHADDLSVPIAVCGHAVWRMDSVPKILRLTGPNAEAKKNKRK